MRVYSVVYYEAGTGVTMWISPLFKSMEGLDAWMSINRSEDQYDDNDIHTETVMD